MDIYLEPETPGLDRRVFRYEHGRIGSYIESAYYADWLNNGERARWYGFAGKAMPEGCEKVFPI